MQNSNPFRSLLFLLGIALNIAVLAQINISAELYGRIEKKYGAGGRIRAEEWQQLLNSQVAKNLPEADKLKKVNDFFNQRIDFVDDIVLWGVEDYWATPIELLAKGAGDCEDYAIAKYFTLKALGVPEEKMRITYVKAVELNLAHMVLTYFETSRSIPLVLDNLIPQIKPASDRNDLLPVYSFNGSGLWLAKARGSGKRVGEAERISLWADLTQRMLKDEL